ncbi:hypothetical protein NE237_015983 [Protea cynaroides]|uniref:Uncharacterized protein n=1 Tax=Protea cynaroides TaxID=273540 RepID=A0A9Q0QRJ6_9MAGN|nr:hypothetical protein NE237_015983 [Protea cynaroides]
MNQQNVKYTSKVANSRGLGSTVRAAFLCLPCNPTNRSSAVGFSELELSPTDKFPSKSTGAAGRWVGRRMVSGVQGDDMSNGGAARGNGTTAGKGDWNYCWVVGGFGLYGVWAVVFNERGGGGGSRWYGRRELLCEVASGWSDGGSMWLAVGSYSGRKGESGCLNR